MALLGLELANVYQNLTNIVLTVTPKAHASAPAVLVNGHYDSAIGSPGDCSSPTPAWGVMGAVECYWGGILYAWLQFACNSYACNSYVTPLPG